ncbi:hypothetical protein M427DRAFT_60676 [Gonapodya prolifera JEL478]|uniref:Uncharacterized protein n=1 Tax=Gonapodya prolifera (strain JEL478) TaxID=1344416 RepID=A0A139A3S9_GONPJ|nr:hypothetical protein M427DRAFT_60676 [Gonapodya prolifera JEL478]|eukprot:KXS11440.1 hypothetical protein M427DRAFT_60676 [Gonapodya prolifera JEL478]
MNRHRQRTCQDALLRIEESAGLDKTKTSEQDIEAPPSSPVGGENLQSHSGTSNIIPSGASGEASERRPPESRRSSDDAGQPWTPPDLPAAQEDTHLPSNPDESPYDTRSSTFLTTSSTFLAFVPPISTSTEFPRHPTGTSNTVLRDSASSASTIS